MLRQAIENLVRDVVRVFGDYEGEALGAPPGCPIRDSRARVLTLKLCFVDLELAGCHVASVRSAKAVLYSLCFTSSSSLLVALKLCFIPRI